jgi:hypothetical protein
MGKCKRWALRGCKYKTYKGTVRTSGGFGTRSVSQTPNASTTFADLEQVSGRIIIDCGAYLENVVSYDVLGKLSEPVFGDSEYVSSGLDLESCLDVLRDVSPSGNPVEHEWTVPGQPSEFIDVLCTSTRVLTIHSDVARLSEEHLLLCGPRFKGYCLLSKAWGMSSDHYSHAVHLFHTIAIFDLEGVSGLRWNNEVFPSLVLPGDYKELIFAFVKSQFQHKESFDDVIAGKGTVKSRIQ